MKINKQITIDYELLERLNEEDNVSGLINSLLIKHYQLKGNTNMTRDERIEFLKKKLKVAKAREKVKELENAARN